MEQLVGRLKVPSAARRLLGLTLEGGWKVVATVQLGPEATGANFSAGYIVQRDDGARGFLKALDFSSASRPGVDTIAELQRLTTEYLFERDLVAQCTNKKLTRVVRGLGHGKVQVGPGLEGEVNYLIFELAERGDIRRHMAQAQEINLVWSLGVLHHVATGLFQLHRTRIAHQDLKPSNVLVFDEEGSKLGDLGRASADGHNPPHDSFDIPGDPTYAPPELLYGFVPPDWNERRLASDLYHLGGLVVFLFTSAPMTGLLVGELSEDHRPGKWRGTYDEVLPYLQKATASALGQISGMIPELVRAELLGIVTQLCEPNVGRRGHPHAHRTPDKYSCERYISAFNKLKAQSERRSRADS
jgi:serine/threonine protein kinase